MKFEFDCTIDQKKALVVLEGTKDKKPAILKIKNHVTSQNELIRQPNGDNEFLQNQKDNPKMVETDSTISLEIQGAGEKGLCKILSIFRNAFRVPYNTTKLSKSKMTFEINIPASDAKEAAETEENAKQRMRNN